MRWWSNEGGGAMRVVARNEFFLVDVVVSQQKIKPKVLAKSLGRNIA